MRRSAALESIWNSGRYFGNNRSNAYVTVNPTWTLANDYSSSSSVYQWWRVPFRRWAGTGTDVEVPKNVLKTISINRAMDQDAAQLTLTIKNVHPDGGPNLAGQGHFSIRQGSPQAGARWPGHTATEWGAWGGGDGDFHYGYLAPGCMIKTYQGWGGYNLSRSAAVSAGNVVITGVWVIDDVNETSNGDLTVSARDLGMLLVDQVMYPDFLPDGCYPTQFYSATWNEEVNDDAAGFYPTATNYADLSEIVELIALWAGFHAPSQDGMLGLLESTGIDSPAPFKADFFDKKTPIDVIKALGEIVGYRAWVNPEGGLHFTSQNTWQAGNRTYGGGYVPFAFDIDEYKTLMDFTGSWTKRADRSNVIVSQGNPAIMEGVKNANFNTNTSIVKNQLHGMQSPAFFPLDRDIPLKEMVTLAELTGLRMWFARHRGTLSAAANPLIDPDDQVRVFEKTTWETYLHRVRSVSTEYDEQTGHYTMNLDLMWVGPDNSGWQVTVGPEGHVNYNGGTE